MYHSTESGLQHVWLKSGYLVRKTPYGKGVAIQDVKAQERLRFEHDKRWREAA